MPACHAFWIGRRLGPMHVACLKSVAAVGHPTYLHVYDEPEDAPAGITLVDAEKTMPRSRIFVDRKTRYYAMFSDLFRYALLRAGVGIYVDCDVYCLKPIPDTEYIYGWDAAGADDIINTGVLKLPPDCPLLDDMWKAASDPAFIPPWRKASKRARLHLRRLLGRHRTADLPRASLGPYALTYYAKRRGMDKLALPRKAFYPVTHADAPLLLDPGVTLDDVIAPETVTVHCCSSRMIHLKVSDYPKGSIAAAIIHGELGRSWRPRIDPKVALPAVSVSAAH